MNTTCIMCPMGCSLEVKEVSGELFVYGQSCNRGAVYGKNEYLKPLRMVTSLVKYMDGVVSVKTSEPVDKKLIFDILKEIDKIVIKNNINCGDILLKDICGSGADLIVTSNL